MLPSIWLDLSESTWVIENASTEQTSQNKSTSVSPSSAVSDITNHFSFSFNKCYQSVYSGVVLFCRKILPIGFVGQFNITTLNPSHLILLDTHLNKESSPKRKYRHQVNCKNLIIFQKHVTQITQQLMGILFSYHIDLTKFDLNGSRSISQYVQECIQIYSIIEIQLSCQWSFIPW